MLQAVNTVKYLSSLSSPLALKHTYIRETRVDWLDSPFGFFFAALGPLCVGLTPCGPQAADSPCTLHCEQIQQWF
jgi:hypothetical protein